VALFFHMWLRFTIVWAVFSAILILATRSNYGSFIGWDKMTTAFFLAVLYVIISIAILVLKALKK
jgi:hypothetical protein